MLSILDWLTSCPLIAKPSLIIASGCLLFKIWIIFPSPLHSCVTYGLMILFSKFKLSNNEYIS